MTLTVLEPEGLYPDTSLEQRIMGPSVRILQGACKASLAELPDELCQQADALMKRNRALADQGDIPELNDVVPERELGEGSPAADDGDSNLTADGEGL